MKPSRPVGSRAATRHANPTTRTISIAQMQRIDSTAIDTLGIPRLLLMEHAGLALAHAVAELASREGVGRTTQRPIVVCCGTGYNGGDGMAAARHLQAWGYALQVAVIGSLDRLRDEPATYADILRRLQVPLLEVRDQESLGRMERQLASCGLIVDALLGIGMRGTVREPYGRLIDRMNQTGRPIVSADIPSGLDGDTGHPQGAAIKAAVTVTFGLPKQGCVTGEGPAHTGTLVVEAITFPPHLLQTPS